MSAASNQVLAAVRELADPIRTAAHRMRQTRRLDDAIVEGLRAAGVFDMNLPTSMGGPGLDPLQQLEVIEELSLADASVGWCAMIGADSGYYPGFLDPATFAQVYPARNLITAGKLAPSGTAVRDGDGWLVSGRWDFGSGSPHADVFCGGVFLHDAPASPIVRDDGIPEFRGAFLPHDAVTVHDTWRTIGLRATGSHDYEVCEPVHVPNEWLFDTQGPMRAEWGEPVFRLPWWYLVKVVGVISALPRRAIDEAVAVAEKKFVMPEMTTLVERPGTLETIARAEAQVRSARSFLVEEMERVWRACVDDGDLSPEATAPLRLAMVHLSAVSIEVCRSMFDLVTTSAIGEGSVLSTLMADAAVANTHVALSHRSWVPLGQRLVGRDPGPTVYI